MTESTNTDTITTRLRDLVSAGGNRETVEVLLEQDPATVAEPSVDLLFRLARALRAQGLDPEAVLAGDSKAPASPREKLAAGLRRSNSYRGGASS
jgi:hypothetical protein